MHTSITLRPGLLDRVKRMSGLASDRALAGAIGVSEDELRAVRDGGSPSAAFLAGLGDAFGLSLGELAVISVGESNSERPAA